MDASLDPKLAPRLRPAQVEMRALDHTDLRLYLQQELLRRCRFNPSYSLRAMARAIGLNHSTLSQIIRGRRPLTDKSIQKICQGLALGPQETENFLRGHQQASSLNGEHTERPQTSTAQLSMDAFHVLADWHHLAILELVKLPDFSNSPRWISRRLGLSLNEINAAIERLIRLEMIQVKEDGAWGILSDDCPNPGDDFFSVAKRKRLKQILELALASLEKDHAKVDDHSSQIFAASLEKLAHIKDLAKEFLAKLEEETKQKVDAQGEQEIFALTLSLFPLSQKLTAPSMPTKEELDDSPGSPEQAN